MTTVALPPTAVHSANASSWLFGDEGLGGLDLADPAEAYHEAAKMYPNVLGAYAGILRLSGDRELQHLTTHAARRLSMRPLLELPAPAVPATAFDGVLAARRSCTKFEVAGISLPELSSVLHAAGGVVRDPSGRMRRMTPSAGGLYPLDVYVVAPRVGGLEPGTYHYYPPAHALEPVAVQPPMTRWAEATMYPDAVDAAGAMLVIAATFTRVRHKYGARAYRFALLEAGHVAQNAILAAGALGLASRPMGGFYDARVDALIGVDGVNEGSLYLVALGHPAADPASEADRGSSEETPTASYGAAGGGTT